MDACRAAVVAIVTFTMVGPVEAQDARSVEVTPYVALGSEAASPVGAAITFPLTSALSFETDVAYRRGEGNLSMLSTNASLLWFLPRIGHAAPYLAGGVGLSQYGAPVDSVTGGPPIGTRRGLDLTANVGGGLMMPMSENLDLRTDVRWIESFGRQGQTEQFRVSQGISFDVGKR